VNPFRSVGARLSLALLLCVTAALGLVYAAVAPSLENRLVNSRLNDLERSAPALAQQLEDNPIEGSEEFFERAARTTNARVALLRPLSKAPEWTMNVLADSQGGGGVSDIRTDPVAINTSRDLTPRRSTVTRDGVRYAEVAVPVGGDGTVLLLSASLARALGDVSLVKRRLLIAGGVVLALVFVVGYALAWVFARRIRRLERAADRIANGMFDEPVVDTGQDEVGELARAFERMRRRLAQLDHARREFIANASHELRTPVFSLGGFLELLDDEELDEETRREFLTTMREQVQRLEKLATELLDLSRLDAGHIDLDREAVALDEVARTAAAEFTAVALQSGHDLEVDARRSVLAIADEQRLLQIARILLENALVHTPGGTHVRIEVKENRGRARLAVTDDGPGIDEAEVANIFERFYRVDGAQASGSGLGLAIARELARLMGGSLELERSDGRTTFAVALPAAAASVESATKTPTGAAT
jgi:signal transduction histidine kinase